ncbi:sugar transferase [Enterococcus faecium]|uniref:sugar transferase n=1 Tax=Enterococcus faecium TaxID=1352 RepID=UPI00129CEB42|nr:sugar transferase [Enterococcus faecium]MCD5103784.1 sugar transferase [Enterococcus faecium]MDK4377304.1 sugar transferase [Enterococcus faecium]MRI45686.1 sugar transferase [Enterococcus faecium]NTL97212.1 sugar transferase [Enterococcus faecium]HAQ0365812.1 sugar transferase [Enterococcus faecium]
MYKRSAKGWAKHLDFIILDCLCLAVAFLASYWIRYGFVNPFSSVLYREMFLIILVFNFVVILFLDTMKNVLKRGYWREMVATLWQAILTFLCITTYLFTTRNAEEYSRIAMYLMLVIYIVLTYLIRIYWKKKIRSGLNNHTNSALLIMASEARAPRLIEEVLGNNYGNHKIVGIVVHDDIKIGMSVKNIPIVATYDSVVDYVTKNWVDEILISVNPDEDLPEEIINKLTMMGVTVHVSLAESAKRVGVKQVVGNIGGLLVISSSMNYMTPKQYFVKRAMDIAGGLAGCVITGILYLILAPLIKKESPGPVFFAQERIGKNGKPFKIYKFRSMYLDAEERKAELMARNRLNDNFMFKMDFDPRVIGNRIDEKGNQKTGIGELIRKYSLDEFPQFFNVLKGDMSMIGTRPPLPSEYSFYSAHHKARLATKPGITGIWQVSGRSDILDFEEVVQLDTQYISNWSIGLDLKILFKTVMVVLKKEGSM